MKFEKRNFAIALVVLALIMSVHVAITFGVESKKQEEAVEVPALVKSKEWCGDCLKQPLKKIANRPALQKASGFASKLRAKKKPARSLLRRLFNR
tara:strand:+ start:2935 stop:3219 length:285 start_codon:yes stop_codon:yes gene_type:complete